MKRYLLDTNMAGDLFEKRGKPPERARQARRNGDRIGIGIPVLAELYYGVEFSASRDKNLQRLRHALSGITIWPFDEKAAAEFGRLLAELRRRGRPMQVIDIMIAAIAITLVNCSVVSADSDLTAVPGLAVENWRLSRSFTVVFFCRVCPLYAVRVPGRRRLVASSLCRVLNGHIVIQHGVHFNRKKIHFFVSPWSVIIASVAKALENVLADKDIGGTCSRINHNHGLWFACVDSLQLFFSEFYHGYSPLDGMIPRG
jgi:tRNA(fMet)-specific endonuclease VapC